MRRTVRRPAGEFEANPLTGLIYCSDCGEKMHNRRSRYDTYKHGKKISPVDNYECKTFRYGADKFVDKCSLHFIRSAVIRELILDTIQNLTTYAKENEAEFVSKLREATTIKQKDTAKAHKRQLAKNEKRIT